VGASLLAKASDLPLQYPEKTPVPVGAAAGCDLLIFTFEQSEARSKDRSLRQLLQVVPGSNVYEQLPNSL
jgi:hypothetical protein